MILFLTATLLISIAGMSALLTLKYFETTTGRVVLGAARPGVGAFFHRTLVWIEQDFPARLSLIVSRGVVFGKKFLHYGIARSILAAERALEWVLGLLRYTTAPTAGMGEASAFLREVAEHKRKLLKRLPVRQAGSHAARDAVEK